MYIMDVIVEAVLSTLAGGLLVDEVIITASVLVEVAVSLTEFTPSEDVGMGETGLIVLAVVSDVRTVSATLLEEYSKAVPDVDEVSGMVASSFVDPI